MDRILLIGLAALALSSNADAADRAHKGARHSYQLQDRQPWSGAGVTVEEIAPHTAAASAGIRPGDVIVGIDGTAVSGYSDIDSRVAASGGRPLTIDIERGGRRLRLRTAPRGMVVLTPDGPQNRRVLWVVHTESRLILMPCAEDPDCE